MPGAALAAAQAALAPHDLGERLAGIDAAANHVPMIAMRRMGDVALAQQQHDGSADALVTDVKMVATNVFVRGGGVDDLFLEAAHEQHALEQRHARGLGKGGHSVLRYGPLARN